MNRDMLDPADPPSPLTLREAIRAALNELGVPGPEYPAPVANAVHILNAALAASPAPAGLHCPGCPGWLQSPSLRHLPEDCPGLASSPAPAGLDVTVDKDSYLAAWRDCYQQLRPAPAGLDVETLAKAMWFEGLLAPEISLLSPDAVEAARSLLSAYAGMVKHRAATRPAEDAT